MDNQASTLNDKYNLKDVQEVIRAQVRPSDKRVWLRRYRCVFTGAQAVQALVEKGISPDPDHAQALGNQLLREGFIYSVPGTVDGFKPNNQLYRFIADDQSVTVKGQPMFRHRTKKRLVPFGSTSPRSRQPTAEGEYHSAAVKIQRWHRKNRAHRFFDAQSRRHERERTSSQKERTHSVVMRIEERDRPIDTSSSSYEEKERAALVIQRTLRKVTAQRIISELFKISCQEGKEMKLKEDAKHYADLLYEGLDIYDQTYLMRTYKLVFTGDHAVKYMLQHHIAPNAEEAVKIGQLLLREKKIYDVCGYGIFRNNNSFYRFKVDQDQLAQEGVYHLSHKRSSLGATMNAPLVIKHHLKVRNKLNRSSVKLEGEARTMGRSEWNKVSIKNEEVRKMSQDHIMYTRSSMSGFTTGTDLDEENIEHIYIKMKEELQPQSVRHRLRTYKNVFAGTDCVNWILDNTDCSTVGQALELGNAMLMKGYIRHCNGHHPLENKKLFYIYNEGEVNSSGSRSQIFGLKEGSSWLQDWRWKLMLHKIVYDSGKKIQEQKLLDMVMRKLKKPQMIIQLLNNLRFMGIPLFRYLTDDLYSQALEFCSFRDFEEGENLAECTEKKSAISIIILGSASIEVASRSGLSEQGSVTPPRSARTLRRSLHRSQLGPSDYFGEASLRDGVQKDTVTAISNGIVFEFSASMQQTIQLFAETSHKESRCQLNIFLHLDDCSFQDIRGYPKAWEALKKFMEAEWAAENTMFIEEVDQFKQIPRQKVEEKDQKALGIYEKFVKPKSEQEVNVTHPQRRKVAEALEHLLNPDKPKDTEAKEEENAKPQKYSPSTEHVELTLFDACYSEVVRLIIKDSFPRFKESLHFKMVLFNTGALKDDPRRVSKVIRKSQVLTKMSKNSGLSMDSVSN
mmetsp:Transcript_37342/g.47040  ORF Transcript_37342/g.47040 Transcript_37342/m.47040 type:complete len:904 (+) Transcript_37342:64-2775(+)